MSGENEPDPSEWVVLPEHLEEYDERSNHSNNTSDNDDDDDDDMLLPPPPSTSGDTPAMVTQRPSSRSRHSTPTAADALLNRNSTMSPPLLRLSHASTPTNQRPTTPNSSAADATRSTTPLSYEALSNRPRSNPRVRTPMRYESPLTSSAFHRSSVVEHEEAPSSNERVEGQRVTIRSNAGLAVGSLGGRNRLQNIPTATTTTPQQQYHHQIQPSYHSHRKMRRWNNDKMVGISSDLAKYAKRISNAAEVFTKGEADAYKYRIANYPLEYKSEFARLATSNVTDDPKLIQVREKFIRGEVAASNSTTFHSVKNSTEHKKKKKEIYSDGNSMYKQIDARLRNVLSRALSSRSRNADRVICAFESFLTSLKADEKMSIDDDNDTGDRNENKKKDEDDALLKEILLRSPAISWKNSTHRHRNHDGDEENAEEIHHHLKKILIAQFVFDAKSSQGGFHRLLLHAVCQFHGLNANSTTTSVPEDGGRSKCSCKARVLTVTGRCHGRKFRLVDYAILQGEDKGDGVDNVGVKNVSKVDIASGPLAEPCFRECSVETHRDEGSVMSDGALVGRMSTLDVS